MILEKQLSGAFLWYELVARDETSFFEKARMKAVYMNPALNNLVVI